MTIPPRAACVILAALALPGARAWASAEPAPIPSAVLKQRLELLSVAEADLGYLLAAQDRRVRALGDDLQRVTDMAARRSPTFARILKALQATDVIVQIVEDPNLPPPTRARLVFAGVFGDYRIVRVQISRGRADADQGALIGHELFHALEVGHAPSVRDAKGLAALYLRIGFATGRAQDVDTIEAHDIERRVRNELSKR